MKRECEGEAESAGNSELEQLGFGAAGKDCFPLDVPAPGNPRFCLWLKDLYSDRRGRCWVGLGTRGALPMQRHWQLGRNVFC